MPFDFDQIIPRQNTGAQKWECRRYFGSDDVIPLWVADMDFASPPEVIEALSHRASHPIYGYTLPQESLFDALVAWMKKRHGWAVEKEWIVLAPGVVPSLYATVQGLTKTGAGIIIQPPVYAPFFAVPTTLERRLIQNPLRFENGRYAMDFAHLDKVAADARMLIFCSPHNPVGRVWEEAELRELLRIARRHNLVIVSDEIHHDHVCAGHRHIPLARLAGKGDNVVTTVAPSKTFNLAGLGLSALIVPDPEHRVAINKAFALSHFNALTGANPFSLTAFEAAYREGEAWLESLLAYLADSRDFVTAYLAQNIPQIKVVRAEGTYLFWLDCRALNKDDDALKDFFARDAKVGFNAGTVFGAEGSGFMRMNLGMPRVFLAQALERIAAALR